MTSLKKTFRTSSLESEINTPIKGVVQIEVPQDELTIQTEDLVVSEDESGRVNIDEVDADGVDTTFIGTDVDFENEAAEDACYEIQEAHALRTAEIAEATFIRDAEIERQVSLTDAIESLREIRTFVLARPTLEARTVKLLDTAINTYTQRFGLEDITIALASLDGIEDETRVDVTEAPVTEVIETAETAVPVSRKNQEMAEQRLEKVRKAEQVAAIDETHVEAGVDPATIVMAQERVRIEETQRQLEEHIDERTNVTPQLDRVQEIVERANETGGMGIESLLATQYCLAAFTKSFGLSEPDLVPGTESFDPNQKYIVSVEAIVGKKQEAEGFLKNTVKRFLSNLMRTVTPIWTVSVVQRTRLRFLYSRSTDLLNVKIPKDAKVKVSGKNLHQNGKVPSNPAQFLAQYAEMTKFLAGPYGKRATAASYANMNKVMRDIYAGDEEAFKKILIDLASGWQDVRKGLPSNLLDFDAPGGRRFFVDTGEATYTGKLAPFKKLAESNVKNIPTRVMWRKNGSRSPTDIWPALTPMEVVKVTKAFREAYESASTLRALMEKFLSANIALNPYCWFFGLAIDHSAGSYFWFVENFGYKEEFNILKKAAKVSTRLCYDVCLDAIASLNSITNSYIGYANASLKVAKRVGNMESQSSDIIEVGNMVRGGNSVGRVVRVSFESFDFNSQTIQASTDKPAYLVRGYRNGEYSAHTTVTRLA